MQLHVLPRPQPFALYIILDDREDFESRLEKCWAKKKKHIELKGFKKGSVPRSVAEKKIGLEVLYKEALDVIVDEAILAEEIRLAHIEEVAVEWQTEEHPTTLTVHLYKAPEVLECPYKDLRVPFKEADISENEIQTMMERIAYSEAIEIPIEDEVPEDRNLIADVDFIIEEPGQDKALATQAGHRFNRVNGKVQEAFGFETEVLKHKNGDMFDYKVTLPDTFMQKEWAGKEVIYKVKINKIFSLELPEINDELAVKVGYKDLEDMKAKVVQDIREEKQKLSEMMYEEQVLMTLVRETKISPIHERLIQNELDLMLQDSVEKTQRFVEKKKSIDEVLAEHNTSRQEWENSNYQRAVNKLQTSLVLNYIASQEQFEISEEEMETELKAVLPEGVPVDPKKLDQHNVKVFLRLNRAKKLVLKIARSEDSNDG